jgi:hypothetical protein
MQRLNATINELLVFSCGEKKGRIFRNRYIFGGELYGALATRLGTLAARLGSLTSRLGTLTKRLGTLAGRRRALTKRLGTLAGRLGIVTTRRRALAGRLGILTKRLGSLSKRPGCINAQFLELVLKNMNPVKEVNCRIYVFRRAKVKLNIYTPESPAFLNQSFFYAKKTI